MTDSILVCRIEFGRGQTQACDVEQRVIAKSTRAARRQRDFAVPARIDDDRLCIFCRADRDKYTSVVGAPLCSAGETPQEFRVVALVARAFASEACRPHAWCAAERLDT